ncbi:uncharacterized protein TNCV_4638581 [Trichonephila clavipes]|uniref:Uncharacterized protein n=1 Tax=Trichonephila clavipes TaxID=2585209 RepID=A0A8X6WD05_TRICX|nr:uncharacterized protein TNCV_4638581 [Trichonephila clavipes]
MIRWALKLSEFNLEWEHRPGVQNVVADLLSRNPVDNVEGSQISCAALRALAINSREQFIKEQREDPELGHIYRYLENPDEGYVNATKSGRRVTVNIDQVRVYRPRQTDMISSDSPVETLYDEQEVSHGSNRSKYAGRDHYKGLSTRTGKDARPEQRQGVKRSSPSSISSRTYKFKRPNTSSPGVESIAGPSRFPDRKRTASTTIGSRTEGSGRDDQTRQTRATTRGRNKQAEKPVRSSQATTRRPCPYYLRSRLRANDGIPEELRNIEINGIPHTRIRRRSLSMEALDGDPVHRI